MNRSLWQIPFPMVYSLLKSVSSFKNYWWGGGGGGAPRTTSISYSLKVRRLFWFRWVKSNLIMITQCQNVNFRFSCSERGSYVNMFVVTNRKQKIDTHIFGSKIFCFHIFGSFSNVWHEQSCIFFIVSPPPLPGAALLKRLKDSILRSSHSVLAELRHKNPLDSIQICKITLPLSSVTRQSILEAIHYFEPFWNDITFSMSENYKDNYYHHTICWQSLWQ